VGGDGDAFAIGGGHVMHVLCDLTIAADKLPSFMGHIAHTTGHRAKRGVAGLVLGVLFLRRGRRGDGASQALKGEATGARRHELRPFILALDLRGSD